MEISLGMLLKGGATLAGGMFAVSFATSTTVKMIQSVTQAKMKNSAKPCQRCKGKGFYSCKLCKGNATIQWSPLYDPIHVNPCLCPVCDGHCVQRCLNCFGNGYY